MLRCVLAQERENALGYRRGHGIAALPDGVRESSRRRAAAAAHCTVFITVNDGDKAGASGMRGGLLGDLRLPGRGIRRPSPRRRFAALASAVDECCLRSRGSPNVAEYNDDGPVSSLHRHTRTGSGARGRRRSDPGPVTTATAAGSPVSRPVIGRPTTQRARTSAAPRRRAPRCCSCRISTASGRGSS